MAVDQPGEGAGQIGVGIDGVELAGFDQRSDDAPVHAALIGAGAFLPSTKHPPIPPPPSRNSTIHCIFTRRESEADIRHPPGLGIVMRARGVGGS